MSLFRSFSSASSEKAKTAILMLNMGGPRNSTEVKGFLNRLFMDRDIIKLPFQKRMGAWIANRRTPSIIEKYNEIGGGSPIFDWTNKQGRLMCELLDQKSPKSSPHKFFIGFRYSHPLMEDALEEIESSGITEAIAFSQYPQYSCTTSGSSMNGLAEFYAKRKSNLNWKFIDRWGTHPLLVKTFKDNILKELDKFDESVRRKVILLFSAHSVPQYVMNRGDPYPAEIAGTVEAVMKELNWCNPYRLVWQSKVGPLPWLQPATDETIKDLVKRGQKNLMLIPISFVNEHIETLHELDIEYAHELGEEVGAEKIGRASAPNDNPDFIEALADLAAKKIACSDPVPPQLLLRCPKCTNPACGVQKKWLWEISAACKKQKS